MKTNEKNILSKFELINTIIENEYTEDKYLEICPLYIKKLFLYKDIKKMIEEFIPNLSYMCKGIVFYTLNNKHTNYVYMMPRDSQIQIKTSSEIDDIIQDKYPDLWEKKNSTNTNNTNDIMDIMSTSNSNDDNDSNTSNELETNDTNDPREIITEENIIQSKYVEIEKNNVVFKVLKTDIPDIYNLYCLDDKINLIKHSIALIPTIKISHNLYYTFKAQPNNLGLNMECKYSKVFEKWFPIKFVENNIFVKTIIDEIENKLKNKEE